MVKDQAEIRAQQVVPGVSIPQRAGGWIRLLPGTVRRTSILFLAVAACFVPVTLRAAPGDVFVSIPPQKFFLQRLLGEKIRVHSMVPNGARPDTFEPSVADIQRLAGAQLFFLLGLPYERLWVPVFARQFPDLQVVACCPGVDLISSGGDDPDHLHDPHVWTSPRQALRLAQMMAGTLTEHYPEHQGRIAENLQGLEQELLELDRLLRVCLPRAGTGIIIVAHPSLSYLARDYGLRQISLESHGREIGSAQLLELIALARRESIRSVYVQPQFSQHVARTLAESIDAQLLSIDPLAEDYLRAMREIVRTVSGTGNQDDCASY